ncbi:MAG TPA: AMP-binding protein [Streptosporangiaceae bacterium]|nr:AMP-binding protein [Streptosporangiaceae bacterium]
MTELSSAYWPADRSSPILDMTVGELLREAVTDAPEATALVEGVARPADRRRWTYAEVLEQAERTARALLGRFEPGERVAVWANNIPEWVLLELAAGLAGITIVTVNPALRAAELTHVLGQSQASGVFLVPRYRGTSLADLLDAVRSELPRLREVVLFSDWEEFGASGSPTQRLPRVSPADSAQVQYTSGTTGLPKGAVLHHRGIVNNARLTGERLGLVTGTVHLSPMPLFHTAGCVMSVLGSIACRGSLVLPPMFEPGLLLELLQAERAQYVLGVPTMLIGVLDHPEFAATDTRSVRWMVTGGAVVPPALIQRVEAAFGVPLTVVFAQTEASPVITQTAPGDDPDDRARTLGRALPQTEVKIIDTVTGQTVAPGVIGEICTRGYHVMTGYLENPDATAAAIDPGGWLHTGDLASMDERGYCRIGGRLKDMIIRGGENIYPREIEQVLFEHDDVADVAVLGIPDPVWGEEVAVFIRAAPGRAPDPEVLFAYCRERLAPHKTPRHWRIVDAFPLTPSGKVKKYVLREQLLADRGTGAPVSGADLPAAAPPG